MSKSILFAFYLLQISAQVNWDGVVGCTVFECYVTRYTTINMTEKMFYMPRSQYIAF